MTELQIKFCLFTLACFLVSQGRWEPSPAFGPSTWAADVSDRIDDTATPVASF